MKKVLILISFITVFACEGDAWSLFGGGGDCKISIKPPEWIRGTWHNHDKDNFITDFIFTKNDAKKITHGSSQTVSLGYDMHGSINCEGGEYIKTENTYGLLSYEFTKIHNDTIEYDRSYYSKK